MIKTQKTAKTQQLNFRIQTNKTTGNKCNNKKISSKILTPTESIANQEDNIFFDFNLELSNVYYKSKQKNIIESDLPNESDIDLKYLKSEKIKLKNSQKMDDNSLVINISSSSNESFKSTKSCLSTSNDINDSNENLKNNSSNSSTGIIHNYNPDQNDDKKFSIFQYNNRKHTTNVVSKEKHVEINNLTESAKLLDRIYGKQWRNIDGIIKSSNIKNLNDELNENNMSEYYQYEENILNTCKTQSKITNYYLEKDFETEVKDTSIILENFSLSNNSNSLMDNQLNNVGHQENHKVSSKLCINECDNIKPIIKSNILKEISDKEKKRNYLNCQSKIPINSNAKLSFLSSLSCFTGTMQCDPEAEKYKLKFKKNKDDLLSVLFKLFNKEIFDNKLPTDMNFKWNARLRSTAGACFNKRSVKITELLDCERVSRIELSSKIIDTAERLRDTLIHELCHAACWIFNGVSEGHGPSWKIWANKAMQRFPELPVIKRCHSYDVQTKFTYKCIKCSYSIGRHSKSLNLEKKRCGFCYGEFELIVNKINNAKATNKFPVVYLDPLKELYNLDDIQKKPNLPKKPSKFALFVKENYRRVKQENINLKHGEIMKLLGSQFSVTKVLTSDEMFDKLLNC